MTKSIQSILLASLLLVAAPLLGGLSVVRGEAVTAESVRPYIPPGADVELLHDASDVTGGKPVLEGEPRPDAVSPAPKTLWMEVTAYCACKRCCGPKAAGVTASGKKVNHDQGRFVAADTTVLPFGTRLSIPGYHSATPVEVIDRGSAIKGNKLDVYFPSHSVAKKWGRRWVIVQVVDNNEPA